MATIRVEKSKDFSIVSNAVLRDKRLSLRTRGLLVFCLSLSDTWEYSIKGLAAATGESEGKIGNCLKELEATGYLTRTRIRDKKGRMMSVDYTLWESPQAQKNDTQPNENPNVDYPSLENPNVDYPSLENPNVDYPSLENPNVDYSSLENPAQINTNLKKYQSKNYKSKQTQTHNTRVCEDKQKAALQSMPFETPAKAGKIKRIALPGYLPCKELRSLEGSIYRIYDEDTTEEYKIAYEWFARFWAVYPRKENQVEARLAWMRLPFDVDLYANIVSVVSKWRRVRRGWQAEGGRYVPMPENFINNERWKDEVSTEPAAEFDKPMDIVTMAGMIVAEGRRQQYDNGQGCVGRVDCVEGCGIDTAQSTPGERGYGTAGENDTIDVAAIWTP